MIEDFNYKVEHLLTPIIKSLQILGGSGSIQEIEENVITLLDLSEEKVNEIHKDNITTLSYKLAIACLYLKESDYLTKSEQGVWILTLDGLNMHNVTIDDIKSRIDLSKIRDIDILIEPDLRDFYNQSKELLNLTWQEKLLEVLKRLPPDKFERLCQRLLRELGFSNVTVTGKVGDGGIDGYGVIKINGIISFNVVFQCKRYQSNVSASEVRDFQGAIMGRADKGLFITTGNFTREAKREAQRDGAIQIDLIDGIELTAKLKEVGLGISKEIIEKITVNVDWFNSI
jgi:restriction system protein